MSTLARYRVRLTQIFSYTLLVVTAATRSGWAATGHVMTVAAVVLVFAGVLGRLWCSLYIGGYKHGMLITEGPYSLCRHPLYLCSLLGAVGVALASRTFTIPLVILVAFAVTYPRIMREEEGRLLGEHGPAYRRYREATPVFVPRLRGLREPNTYPVHPAAFRSDLRQSAWFVVALVVVMVLARLHESGIVPSLMTLY